MKELNRKIVVLFIVFMLIQNFIVSACFFGILKGMSDKENEKYYFNILDRQILDTEANVSKLKKLSQDLANNVNVYSVISEGFDSTNVGEFHNVSTRLDTQLNTLTIDNDFVKAVILIPDTENLNNSYAWYSTGFSGRNVDLNALEKGYPIFENRKYNPGKICWEGECELVFRDKSVQKEFLATADLIHVSGINEFDFLGTAIFIIDKEKCFFGKSSYDYMNIVASGSTLFEYGENTATLDFAKCKFEDGKILKNGVAGGGREYFMCRSETLGWEFYMGIKPPRISNLMIWLFVLMLAVMICSAFLMTYFVRKWSAENFKSLADINEALTKIANNDYDVSIFCSDNEELASICENVNYAAKMLEKSMIALQNQLQLEKALRLEVMQYQINPHFIYNTLAAIRAEALENSSSDDFDKKENVARNILLLTEMLKKVYSTQSKVVPLSEEISLLKDYMFFCTLRFEKNIDVEYKIDPSLEDFSVPTLLLQPILENSVFHGLSERINEDTDAKIRISAQRLPGKIVIGVWDNGMGMSEEKIAEIYSENPLPPPSSGKRRSIGLKNTLQRIKLVYGERGKLKIESKKGEYTLVAVVVYDSEYGNEEE